MQSIQALSNNKEAKYTDLYAFIDGHKVISQIHLIDAVEKIIFSYKDKFKTLNIIRSNVNLSSAVSQRRGLSEVLNNHETVINVEDDVVVSPYFLSYMNKALNKYKNNPDVWHINGYSYPVNFETKFDCFFIRVMLCWGWGTWRDKWEKFNNDPLAQDPFYIESIFDEKLKKEFDFFKSLYLKKSLPRVLMLSGHKGIGKFTLVNEGIKVHKVNWVRMITE